MSRWTLIFLAVLAVGGYFVYDWWQEGNVETWWVSDGDIVRIGGEARLSPLSDTFEITAPTDNCWQGDGDPLTGIDLTETTTSITVRVRSKNQITTSSGDCDTVIVETVTLTAPVGNRQLLMDDGDQTVPASFRAP